MRPQRGGPVVQPANTAWLDALEKANLKNFRWHDLRHTWASWHVQNGTPLPVLMELGGWKALKMVLRYAHLAPTHVAKYASNGAKFLGQKSAQRLNAKCSLSRIARKTGVADGTRTHDNRNHNPGLYQLSYSHH
jgi:hypothetical protein